MNNEDTNTSVESNVEVQNQDASINTSNVNSEVNQNPVATTKTNKINDLVNKIKNLGKGPIIGGCVLVVVIIALVVFRVFTSSPKAVFKNVINGAYKEVHNALDKIDKYDKKYNFEEEPVSFKLSAKIDSSMEELKDLTDYNYKLEAGIDYKNNKANAKAAIEGKKSDVDAKIDIVDDKLYLSSSIFDQIIDITDQIGFTNISFKELKKEMDKENIKIDVEDYDYIAKIVKNALIKSIDKDSLEKEKDEFEVDGKTVKATKVTYVLDDDSLKDLMRNTLSILEDDKDFIKKIADISGLDKDDIKDNIKELRSEAKDISFSEKYKVNVFTKGLFNKVVGFNIELQRKEYLSIYSSGKKTEFRIDNNSSYSEFKVVALAEKNGKKTNVTVKYNGDKVAELDINEWSEKLIDVNYKINVDSEKYNGTVYISQKENKNSVSGDYKFSIKGEDDIDFAISGNYSLDVGKDLDVVNTKKAVSVDEVDFDKLQEDIDKAIEKDEKLKSLFDGSIDDIEESALDLNYNGMRELESEDDAIDLLSRDSATVLLVGSNYYFEDYSQDMVDDLEDLQEELGFHSYYLSEYDVTDEFWNATKDAQYTCELNSTSKSTDEYGDEQTVTCKQQPTIYLIKDGKIVKGIRGKISKDDLKKSLNEIGIN